MSSVAAISSEELSGEDRSFPEENDSFCMPVFELGLWLFPALELELKHWLFLALELDGL